MFVLEHALNYMWIPGKVENMIIVIDLAKLGITELPGGVHVLFNCIGT
jgi:hypothetical protein